MVAHHSVRLARVMVLDVERITNMSCDAGVSLTQASYVHETVRIHAHHLDHTGQVSLMEGLRTMSRPPTQITCCKTCTMPPPGNAVGRHQSDVHLSPSVEADKTSAVSPSGREPHRTIKRMSTPRPRATQGCPEDAHTPAKSHTLLHLLKQTRAMGHTGRATTKKKKSTWLCWFLFRAVAVVSRLAFCVAPALSPFCGVRGPACVASWLSVDLPFSFRAPTQELAFPVLFRYPLPVCLKPLVCSMDVEYIFIGSFSLSCCSQDLLSRCSPHSGGALCCRTCGDIRLHGRTSGTFGRREPIWTVWWRNSVASYAIVCGEMESFLHHRA